MAIGMGFHRALLCLTVVGFAIIVNHGFFILGSIGDLLFDSGSMSAAGTARVDAGATWRDVIAAADPHGLAPLNGFSGTVGVSGYTLGGGIGWLVRQYGAAAGSLRSAELVTADGRLLRVNDKHYADLFWGLRGGGGNFGIVTSFEFDLYPVKEIFGGFVVYPIGQGKQALSAYGQWTKTVPDTLTSAVRLVHYPPAPVIPAPLRGVSPSSSWPAIPEARRKKRRW
jgi:FAD/FMN-containing dehydrogenase